MAASELVRIWERMIAHHANRNWDGQWTRYTPQGDLMQSFKSLRKLKISNSKEAQIKLIICHYLADGSTRENEANIELCLGSTPQITCNLMEGYVWMFFESGHGAALALDHNKPRGGELFFRHEELRLSTPYLYKERKLSLLSCIREDSRGYPSKHWSMEVNSVSERSLAGNWEGNSVTLSVAEFTISDPVPTLFQWGWEGHQVFYLPDGVTVSCPSELIDGVAMILVTNWLVSDTKMHQMMVKYDDNHSCVSVTLDLLELKN